MSFLTPMLLAGAALVAIPIALHLAMRRQPVRMPFPALRLLKKRRHQNETRLRLRRWLLLALRCAAVALLALALARPVLRPPSADGGESDGPAGEGLAVGLVFDNAPNAAYRQANRTRLEAAQETAAWLLERATDGTRVVVADRARGGRASEGNPAAATLRVDRLTLAAATRPLGVAVRDALERLAETPAARREAYVFTDLSRGAWNEETRQIVAAALDRRRGVTLRLVDVGVAAARNVGVGVLRLSSERPAVGEPLRVEASLVADGQPPESVAVELWLRRGDGPAEKRAEKRLAWTDESAEGVAFTLAGLERGDYAGSVRVLAGDAAPIDDERHFAVAVRDPPEVLIAAPQPDDAVFVREALDPSVAEPGVAARFATATVRFDALGETPLADAEAVLLLDPPPLGDRLWRRLTDYATAGGAVGVFLGRNAQLDAFNGPEPRALLPATLRWRSRDETYLRPTRYTHPAIAPLAEYAEAIPWPAFPVFQRWELASVVDGAVVVATYADGGAAIVEHAVGRGRVVMMTTPLSDRLDRPDPWNLLPTGDTPWPFFLLVDAVTEHLAGGRAGPLNHRAGDTVSVPLPPGEELPGVVIRTPRGEAIRQAVPPGAAELAIGLADQPGGYRVTAGAAARLRLASSFAVNIDPDASRLERTPLDELESALGPGRVTLVQSRDELSRAIDQGRVGRELYGWVLALVAAAWGAEQVVSNRFYRAASDEREPA